jgi:hypothetical protein
VPSLSLCNLRLAAGQDRKVGVSPKQTLTKTQPHIQTQRGRGRGVWESEEGEGGLGEREEEWEGRENGREPTKGGGGGVLSKGIQYWNLNYKFGDF